MRRLLLVAGAVVLLATPAVASSDNWWFKTPGGAAYCGTDVGDWICMRPRDGFWIRLDFDRTLENPDVRKGTGERYRGYRGPADRTLGFGQVFYTSDARIITCWSRRTGVTCKHFQGLSFTLGRSGRYRIFYDAPGFRPNVFTLFKTPHGIYCGIDKDTLVPEKPSLHCWNPMDGLEIGIRYLELRGSHGRSEQLIGFRPRGFRTLADGETFEWRCRRVTATLAERCSTGAGEPVFTCTSTRARLTCRNRNGHGFWANARSFYTF